ncbi:MAG: hypothetical protein OEU90_04465 [Gammaproteobacteria bacterium]|jgi:hypothetical protein|nr:hypothetical protein [Gammaproteobacteria bacterium]MDH3750066.1 hypothetical protein [Gammaproteobacteria bacterium]MDH3804712.1 hypothetical protein [Gammaproteobacteria bacterium]
MKYRTAISILMASILAVTSVSSFAGHGKGQGGNASADRTQQVDRDRTYDRDRISDRDRTQDRDRIDVPDQVRDRDRIHDPANLKDQDIYGNELMSTAERKKYRKELGKANTQQSREKFQAKHETKMQKRALNQGQDLVPPGQGPIHGGEYMTVQERNEYREQLRLFDSENERQKYQAQHRERMDERARALGYEVEEAE